MQLPLNKAQMTGRFGHFKQLDGLRGLSITLVLAGHIAQCSLCTQYPFIDLPQLANLGVLLFFVLSGFLITGLLCSEESITGHISLRGFYMRRLLRIMPDFYTMLAIVGILMLTGLVTDVPWYAFTLTAFYLRNFAGRGETLAHTWSLSMEEQFYLVWPWLLTHLNRTRRIPVVLCICLTAPILRAIAVYSGTYVPWQGFKPYYWYDCILIGCLIALIWTYHKGNLEARAKPINSAAVLVVLLLWTLLADSVPALEPFYRTVQVFCAALMLTNLIANENSHFARLLSSRPLCWFGKVSYSVYLWQQLFIVTKLPSWGFVRVFPNDLACAILAGVLSYYFIERPFLKLKDRWASCPQ